MSKYEFPRLFSSLNVGSLTLANRIVMPALNLVYSDNGCVNDRLIAFYSRRAQGGAGLLIVGGCAVDRRGRSAGMLRLDDSRYGTGLKALTDAIHAQGTPVAAQLFHAGRYARVSVTGEPGLAPSAVYSRYAGALPQEMSSQQITQAAQAFGQAAVLAKQSGFDAVELSAGAGYLISQFLSPLTNLRTDEFGGSMENRFRFAGMVMDHIRTAVGKDYPVLVRIGGNDFLPGGNTLSQAVEFARFLEQKGAAAIDVTGGWHETAVPQLTGHLPPGGLAYLAARIKDALAIPVLVSNRIHSPALGERLIALGAADAVCMGRQLVCDPDTPEKIRTGRQDQVIPCVACGQGCTDHTFAGKSLGCVLNPFAGREEFLPRRTQEIPRNVAVVGGGAAGMGAAITAAGQGHHVTLYERSACLGGSLRALSAIRSKAEYARLLEVVIATLYRSGVRVRLEEEYTTDHNEDCVVLAATGAKALELNNQGFPGTVCTAEEVLLRQATPGRRVAVIGNTGICWETAIWLAEDAQTAPATLHFLRKYQAEDQQWLSQLEGLHRREITVISTGEKPAAGIGIGARWIIKSDLTRHKISVLCAASQITLTPAGVQVILADGTCQTVTADTVVAASYEQDRSLAQSLECQGIRAYTVGAAAFPGTQGYTVTSAIRSALHI